MFSNLALKSKLKLIRPPL
ncbi:uncharacterized protein FFFS_14434 [Fusarium fujikuroi]|nr:uncharacterized protein FFFS_14434 [Fusarium fujikuroi]